ncbi:unnamed protein product [Linum tenue]|uniref:Uncharacterized protein n=1 Tax=Linum tenue TaxID=586396 RepID=A0AAV0LY17_9ROSI|nr:unnamed protein product [Linum tenue]
MSPAVATPSIIPIVEHQEQARQLVGDDVEEGLVVSTTDPNPEAPALHNAAVEDPAAVELAPGGVAASMEKTPLSIDKAVVPTAAIGVTISSAKDNHKVDSLIPLLPPTIVNFKERVHEYGWKFRKKAGTGEAATELENGDPHSTLAPASASIEADVGWVRRIPSPGGQIVPTMPRFGVTHSRRVVSLMDSDGSEKKNEPPVLRIAGGTRRFAAASVATVSGGGATTDLELAEDSLPEPCLEKPDPFTETPPARGMTMAGRKTRRRMASYPLAAPADKEEKSVTSWAVRRRSRSPAAGKSKKDEREEGGAASPVAIHGPPTLGSITHQLDSMGRARQQAIQMDLAVLGRNGQPSWIEPDPEYNQWYWTEWAEANYKMGGERAWSSAKSEAIKREQWAKFTRLGLKRGCLADTLLYKVGFREKRDEFMGLASELTRKCEPGAIKGLTMGTDGQRKTNSSLEPRPLGGIRFACAVDTEFEVLDGLIPMGGFLCKEAFLDFLSLGRKMTMKEDIRWWGSLELDSWCRFPMIGSFLGPGGRSTTPSCCFETAFHSLRSRKMMEMVMKRNVKSRGR